MEKVKVVSTVKSRMGVKVPEMRFSRQWLKKGSAVMIDRDILEELMYDSGFKYMIDSGMLYIEDMAVKKELGLEPEDAKEPVNIIVLSDKEMRHYMVTMPLAQFKEKVAELSQQFGGWSGDVSQEFTFWGSYNVEPNEIVAIIEGRDFSGAAAGNVEIEL